MMTRAMEPTTGPAIHASLFMDEVELVGVVDDVPENVVVAIEGDEEVPEVMGRLAPWAPRELKISFQFSKAILVAYTA
jgi:hypothetical protein